MRNNVFNILSKYLKITMPIVYVTLGVVLICTPDALFKITGVYRLVFGILMVAYGAMRFYQTYFKNRENEE